MNVFHSKLYSFYSSMLNDHSGLLNGYSRFLNDHLNVVFGMIVI